MASARPSKKRKATVVRGAGDNCALCGFGASTVDHLFTHVREEHPQMAAQHPGEPPAPAWLALEVGIMLLQRALDEAALGGATSSWLAGLQPQLRAATDLTKMLQIGNPSGVADALRRLLSGDESALATTMKEAAQILTQPPPPDAAAPVTIKTEASTDTGATASAPQKEKDPESHEAEAAQALTGLRGVPETGSAAVGGSTVPVAPMMASARPPAVPKPSPTAPHATFPSFSLGSPLSIIAPQPQLSSPHYNSHVFTPGTTRSPGTPSSLPSIFSRGLLVSQPSPSNQTDPGDRLAQGVAGMPFPSPTMATDAHAMIPSGMVQDASPASVTHSMYFSPFPIPVSTPTAVVNGAATKVSGIAAPGTSSARPTVASPAKRKSITSKQLSVRCDAEVAAARAAAASAAVSSTSGAVGNIGSLDALPVPATPITPSTRKANPRRWTKEEDDALRAAVENHQEKNWKAIAAEVPGRNHTQCLQRWTKVLAPGLVKGHWSPHEDDLLRRLVATEQKNWGDVAAKIPGRTSKQCRERWHNHLDPQIVRGAYTAEEDRLIVEAQARLGNRWSVIASLLPGRTEDAVKIRWKSHCRVWKARKYLRKNPNSDLDLLSEPAQTPRTPLVLPSADFKWPVPLPPGVEERQSESSTSKSSGGASKKTQVAVDK